MQECLPHTTDFYFVVLLKNRNQWPRCCFPFCQEFFLICRWPCHLHVLICPLLRIYSQEGETERFQPFCPLPPRTSALSVYDIIMTTSLTPYSSLMGSVSKIVTLQVMAVPYEHCSDSIHLIVYHPCCPKADWFHACNTSNSINKLKRLSSIQYQL